MISLTDRKPITASDSHPRLKEVSKRLLNLMNKIGCPAESFLNEDISIDLLKDMIYDIQVYFED